MTLGEVKELLKSSGLPVAYRQWPEEAEKVPPLPYLIYYEDSTDSMLGDGAVYYIIRHITVELYSKERDLDAEAKLENLLQGLHWKRQPEQYLDTEHMMMCSYEFEV